MDNEDKTILWIDLTESGGATLLPSVIGGQCFIHQIRDPKQISSEIHAVNPNLACFEYDYPDHNGLAALSETKRQYPALPILLITTYHSEALAVWALRARVWDYIVKPYSLEDVLRTLELLSKARRRQSRKPRKVIAPIKDALRAPPFSRLTGKEKAILRTKCYIERHLGEKIQQASLAKQCGMSLSHFSRAFRQICGVGFSEFLLRTRIEKALHRLADQNSQITNICYEVGFRDVSYFGRIFRRYVGMSPSEYKNAQKELLDSGISDRVDKTKFDTRLDSIELTAQQKPNGLSIAVSEPSRRQPALIANSFGGSPLWLMGKGTLN